MADALNRNLFTACIFQPGPHGTGHSADGVLQLILTYQVISFPGIVLQVVELIDTPDTLVKNIFIPVAAHSENSRGLRVSIFPIVFVKYFIPPCYILPAKQQKKRLRSEEHTSELQSLMR